MTNRAPQLSWTIPRPGETIANKYVVEGFCGRGGLAVVLSAMHAALDQRVALKMLLPEWAGDADVVERFLREGRAATRIRSEHVVRVFDVGTLENGAPYLVLEYLEGHNLDDVVAMWGPVPVPTAVDWVMQAAEAIAEAHAYGIVHRDLKPANLVLTHRADGSACVKVIDFGLSKLTDPRMRGASAKLTRPTDVMGSPHYMAPEQLRATCEADPRADLWALGAVLHELISGQPPFRGDTMSALCATVLTQPPPPLSSLRPDIPPAVEEAVLRCLEKDPMQRFANAAELARAIAPYGTQVARASCARIERVLEGRASDIPLLEPMPEGRESVPSLDAWPSDANLPFRSGTSARIVLGSFLMLAGLGIGVFMWMYESVHANDPPVVVAAPIPTMTSAAPRIAPATVAVGPASVNTPPPAPAPAPAPAPSPSPSPPLVQVSALPRAHAAAPPVLTAPMRPHERPMPPRVRYAPPRARNRHVRVLGTVRRPPPAPQAEGAPLVEVPTVPEPPQPTAEPERAPPDPPSTSPEPPRAVPDPPPTASVPPPAKPSADDLFDGRK